MSFKPNRAYNNPEIGAAMNSIASMFGPPDSGELVNYAQARGLNQTNDIIEKLRSDPRYAGADAGVLANLFDPTNSWAAQDQNTATTQRGQDIGAATSRANNSDDNSTTQRGQDVTAQTSITNNLADNRRALVQTRFGPVAEDAILPDMPGSIAGMYDLPALPGVQGNRSPLTESEFKAGQLEELLNAGTLAPADFARDFRSGVNVEEVVGPDGKPIYASRDAAIGMQPAPKAPLVNIGPNGEQFGNPGEGLVWARNPDNSVKLDERGAPIAIPYRGGKAWEEQLRRDEAAAAGGTKDELKSSVVLQNLDRALDAIEANPTFTTGLGAQATGWIGGSPARALEAVLDPIRANIGFDQLQDMRDLSPTGGALGQVTVRELELLQSVLGNIDLEAGPQVIDDVKRLKNIYLDTVHGAGNGPPRERLSFPSQWDQFADNAEGAAEPEGFAVNPRTGERLAFRNGQWVPVEASR